MPSTLSPKRAGIEDVARLAGVSRQTVTRAMNDLDGINPETKRRVLQAAQDLHYRPSRSARRMRVGESPIVGLVVPELSNPFFGELASRLADDCAARGWGLELTQRQQLSAADIPYLATLASHVDAVVGYFRMTTEESKRLFRNMVVVEIDPRDGEADQRAVTIDYDSGVHDAVSYLAAQGRRDIVMVDSPADGRNGSDVNTPSLRAKSFIAACEELGIEPAVHWWSLGASIADASSGRDAARAIVASGRRPDGLLAYNDAVAIGVLKEFALAGIDVPSECAVIGIDGSEIGELVTPELTTLRLDMAELAQRVLDDVAIGWGHSPSDSTSPPALAHSLVVRQSA